MRYSDIIRIAKATAIEVAKIKSPTININDINYHQKKLTGDRKIY